ncbi:hypothetical protein ACLOJK_020659 [Asimina triloba]
MFSSGGVRVSSFLEFRSLLSKMTKGASIWRGIRSFIGHSSIDRGIVDAGYRPKERLASQEEDLQAGLTLSREEACRSGLLVASPKALVDPAPLGLALSSVLVVDVRANITSSIPIFELEASKVSRRKDVEPRTVEEQGPSPRCGADLGEVGVPIRRGVLGPTFGETFSCPSSK